MLTKNEKNDFKEYINYLRKEKVKYDFFDAKEDITIYNPENNEIIGKINKGDAILRVGDGLVVPNLPIETMYIIKYKQLLSNDYISLITDELLKLELAHEFKDVIAKVNLKLSSDILYYLEIFNEFIVIPDKLKNNFKQNIDLILENK